MRGGAARAVVAMAEADKASALTDLQNLVNCTGKHQEKTTVEQGGGRTSVQDLLRSVIGAGKAARGGGRGSRGHCAGR